MTEQVGITVDLLDKLLDLGLGAETHHKTLQSRAKAYNGFVASGQELKNLRRLLGVRAEERNTRVEGPAYVAGRRFTLLGKDYVPGDQVDMEGVKPSLHKLLVQQRKIIVGGAD
jgi:hypothetical protein